MTIPAMSPYPNKVAGGVTSEGTFQPFELFAGEKQIVTTQATSAAAIAQFVPVVRDKTGAITVWDGATGQPNAVTAQPISAGSTGPIYVSAFFNNEALVWPAAISTLAARKGAFVGSNIEIGSLL